MAGLGELGAGADGGFGERPVGGPGVGAAVGVERPVALAASDRGFGGGDMAIVGEDVKVLELVVDGGEEIAGGCDAVADGVDPGCAGQRCLLAQGMGRGGLVRGRWWRGGRPRSSSHPPTATAAAIAPNTRSRGMAPTMRSRRFWPGDQRRWSRPWGVRI